MGICTSFFLFSSVCSGEGDLAGIRLNLIQKKKKKDCLYAKALVRLSDRSCSLTDSSRPSPWSAVSLQNSGHQLFTGWFDQGPHGDQQCNDRPVSGTQCSPAVCSSEYASIQRRLIHRSIMINFNW